MCMGHKHGHRFPYVRQLFAWEVGGRRVHRCVTGSVNGSLRDPSDGWRSGQRSQRLADLSVIDDRMTPNWPNLPMAQGSLVEAPSVLCLTTV